MDIRLVKLNNDPKLGGRITTKEGVEKIVKSIKSGIPEDCKVFIVVFYDSNRFPRKFKRIFQKSLEKILFSVSEWTILRFHFEFTWQTIIAIRILSSRFGGKTCGNVRFLSVKSEM